MPRVLFVDTAGWYAAFNRKDRSHRGIRAALGQARKARVELMTSTDVLDETLTLVRMRVGHALAVSIGNAIWHEGGARVLQVDAPARELAWELFVRYADSDLSFTDCTSAALMKQRGIEEVLTLDHHFSVLGFRVVPSR